jgi:lysophospholipase L1-like esterase
VAACSAARHDAASAGGTQQAEVRYTAIGDSAAAGIGSRVPCMPFKGCDDGTSYVGVLARRLRAAGPVRLTNMGTPGAVLSPTSTRSPVTTVFCCPATSSTTRCRVFHPTPRS